MTTLGYTGIGGYPGYYMHAIQGVNSNISPNLGRLKYMTIRTGPCL